MCKGCEGVSQFAPVPCEATACRRLRSGSSDCARKSGVLLLVLALAPEAARPPAPPENRPASRPSSPCKSRFSNIYVE